MYKLLHFASIIFALAGTYLLAFGLKIRSGISNDLRENLDIERKDLIAPSDVTQRTKMVSSGLLLITIAAALQLWLIAFS